MISSAATPRATRSTVRPTSVSEWVEFAAQSGFMVSGVTRRRLPLAFGPWIDRQRVPAPMAEAIRALFAAVPADVRAHFDVRDGDDFTIDTAVFELRAV